ncbi:MAG: hypothetical protein K5879_04940 [Lachnospiraceae bacterium]|nr:hypothetical protein [Lachnospiraceae bacterium]
MGTGFLFAGIVYLFRKKEIREEHFAKAAIFEFTAGFVMYIPQELFNDIPSSLPVLNVIESLLTALLRSISIYMGNGYERAAYVNHPVFTGFYATVMAVSHILLLLFIAGFVIRLFENPVQRFILSFRKRRYSYVFSGCNEKSLTIAESIYRSIGSQKKVSIVFAVADAETGEETKQRIRSMKGVFTDIPVKRIVKRMSRKSKGVEVFLFGDSEEKNLVQLEQICDSLKTVPNCNIKIFVELIETPWNLYGEFIKELDSKFGEKLIINLVRTEENFVFNNLFDNSVFENAIPKEDAVLGKTIREIKVLLIGMNERNLEMFRAVLHLGQMPGYRMNVMVIEDGAKQSILRERFPEIKEECNVEGDALYKIMYRENTDYRAEIFDEIIRKEYPDFTFAFVNAGDDILNANIAMRLNAICCRANRKDGYSIQANILNRGICKCWSRSLTENISFVGSIEETYNYDFITMSGIEKATVAIHYVRYPDGSKPWYVYCNDEYNRHSVYARTLSFKHKVRIIDEYYRSDYSATSRDEVWKIYEHMRWNMYTRVMGYVRADEALLDEKGELDRKLRVTAKVHNCLVPFEELDEKEKKKDSLVLTQEVVGILKNC